MFRPLQAAPARRGVGTVCVTPLREMIVLVPLPLSVLIPPPGPDGCWQDRVPPTPNSVPLGVFTTGLGNPGAIVGEGWASGVSTPCA